MLNNHNFTQSTVCPVCEATDVSLFIEIHQVPIHCNLLWPSSQEARQASRGDIWPGFCRNCGHIFNLAFKPELMEYTQAYENSLHFSPHFQEYARSLALHLIERYDLRGRDIIDIGCGKGDFLKLICKLGDNHGIGFDRSYVPEQDGEPVSEQVTFIQDFYSERYADCQADLICCRHVLEHIQFPLDFLGSIHHAMGDSGNTVIFFEVPNVMFTLRDLGIWDLIYEHCSYFSADSLAWLFRSYGFEVLDLAETYERQFLTIEAVYRPDLANSTAQTEDNLREMETLVVAFADNYRRKVDQWRRDLEQMAQAGRRVVAWGSGSKGVTFLNILETQDQIAYVVDINPRKQGMYVAGTGQKIVAPDFLAEYKPDVVIGMNPIYSREIQADLNRLGVTAELLLV